ncbi:hypothetical protein FRC06_003640 [Ceratobasidium sp. 370]|nr:hypothetical protein FRC06_003640 [Ceratobasidium sp. 370]
MATENPPAYHEVTTGLKELTPEKRESLTAAMVEHFQKPQTTKDLVSEVNALANGVSAVDKLFFNVSVDLGKLTDTGENLKGKWDGYYVRFTNIMKTSKFVGVVMPVIKAVKGPEDEQGRREALDVLKGFLEKVQEGKAIDLTKLEELAHQYSDEFHKLKKDVGDFVGIFTKYADARGATLTTEIKNARDNLKQLNDELTKINAEVTRLGLAMGITAFATAAGAYICAAFLGPIGLIGALIIGLTAIGVEAGFLADAIKRAGNKKTEVDLAQAALDKLVAEQKTLVQLKTRLESQQGEVLTIAQKIDQLGLVWVSLALDAKRLHAELETFASSKPASYTLFQTHIKQTEELYKPLRTGLEAYVKHEAIPEPNK